MLCSGIPPCSVSRCSTAELETNFRVRTYRLLLSYKVFYLIDHPDLTGRLMYEYAYFSYLCGVYQLVEALIV